MSPKRRRVWVSFALAGALAAIGLFALHDAASGVVMFVALLVFFAACIHALKGEDADELDENNRRTRDQQQTVLGLG